jgi:hypothetical protein
LIFVAPIANINRLVNVSRCRFLPGNEARDDGRHRGVLCRAPRVLSVGIASYITSLVGDGMQRLRLLFSNIDHKAQR